MLNDFEGELCLSVSPKVCFEHGINYKDNYDIFPEETISCDAYLEFDGTEIDSDDNMMDITIKIVPYSDTFSGEKTNKLSRDFHLGSYKKEEIKKIFTRVVNCL